MSNLNYEKANISAALANFMYLAWQSESYRNYSLDAVFDKIKTDPTINTGTSNEPNFKNFSSAIANTEGLGNLKVYNQSSVIGGYNSGTYASAFYDDENIYIAFRGTGHCA